MGGNFRTLVTHEAGSFSGRTDNYLSHRHPEPIAGRLQDRFLAAPIVDEVIRASHRLAFGKDAARNQGHVLIASYLYVDPIRLALATATAMTEAEWDTDT